ncbi:hypothetical protein EST38_g6023 [Candolleomyces aberdarensis]|uniref:Response regulatory domain-containing protein n=1 Tax=Candolleomyces aberdarensis TaxID=2316362 RepID=A0A4Q2DL08_9AGAR|nr:hypothetical protein EST38_g6023 [Candolleomyces aberdarensis]
MEAVTYSLRQTVFGTLMTNVVRASKNNPLRQVIINLVGNAIKFAPSNVDKKGHVSLSCRLLAQDGQSVTLEVCVTEPGIGIAEDKLNLIFDTFRQADGSTTRASFFSYPVDVAYLRSVTCGSRARCPRAPSFTLPLLPKSRTRQWRLLSKIQPFAKHTILFVDTLRDKTGVVQRIRELGLRPYFMHDATDVGNKETRPHIDTIVVDSLSVVNLKWCLYNLISSQITTLVSAQHLASSLISALESNTVSPVSAPNDVTFDILLAEDNLVNQKLAVKILEKYGHLVGIAENGSLAVDAYKARVAQNKPFVIILMDVSMPFMGGMESTELIRSYEMHKGLPPTPIIALTAHAMIGDRERCLHVDMDDHITKPLCRGDLLNAINKLGGGDASSYASTASHQAGCVYLKMMISRPISITWLAFSIDFVSLAFTHLLRYCNHPSFSHRSNASHYNYSRRSLIYHQSSICPNS